MNVGLPKNVQWRGQQVFTGIWKQAVDGLQTVRRLNIDGDGQGDLAGHGGEQRAVLVYQTSAYEFWSSELHRTDFTPGQFGENFTVEGLPDDEVRIGDRFHIGSAVFEVSQPRVTCYRVGIRMNDAQMPARLVAEGRPGFYLRVLEEGQVQAGDAIDLRYRNSDSPTVAGVDALLYRPHGDRSKIRQALQIPALSPGWRLSLQAILDQPVDATGNAGLATTDLSPSARPGFRAARIVELSHLTAEVMSVSLEAADDSELDPAQPGQFIVLRALVSPASPPIMRSYSLAETANAHRYELGVKCEPSGSMGSYLSERARVGDPVEISAPRGSFVLRASDRPAVLTSAGIGITPVLAMLRALVAARSQRSVWWLYGARNGAEHPFADEVRTLLSGLPNARSHFRYSRPSANDRPGRDFDSVGHVDAALVEQLGISKNSEFYLCGPAAFLADMKTHLPAAGFPAEQVYSEVFGSGPALNPGIVAARRPAPHAPAAARGSGPTVSFARSGLNVPWSAQFSSLLEFAEACDVPTRWSCRAGVCHTCESGLISGEVSYEPVPLQPPANGNVLVCCSRPKNDVVVDL
ncbi:MAG: MOSC and FAD-binding oxidoreductase domain-containing protein [Candidatus Velthaea sp.]